MPKPDYDTAVEAMVSPLRTALERDPTFFCGKIIFQKDGYDMNGMTPVASALPQQLQILAAAGYRVVSVGELLRLSPFADLPESDPCFGAAKALAELRVPVAFRFNDIRPDESLLWGQLCMMLCPPDLRLERVRGHMAGARKLGRLSISHPYAGALAWADGLGIQRDPNAQVSGDDLAALCAGAGLDKPARKRDYTRREGIIITAQLLRR